MADPASDIRIRRLPDVLRARAATMPDHPAHDDTTRSLTFADWDREADAIGGGLAAAGVTEGDRVLLPITNAHATWFASCFIGVQRAGGICVPTNPRSSQTELRAFADLTGAEWAITDVPERIEPLRLRAIWTVTDIPDDPASLPDQGALDPDADSDIVGTSGTTGRPKGVVFSHAELVERIDPTELSKSRSLLHALPFTGYGGSHAVMMTPLRIGSLVITQPQFEALGFLDLIAGRRPDSLQLVPAMLRMIVDHPRAEEFDASSVKWIFTGTAPLPHDTVERVEELWPHARLINVYGMTEGSVGAQTTSRDSVRKPGSVGKPADRSKVQIRDDGGNELPDGEIGEIWTETAKPRRYWNDPEATAAAWLGGWLRTGDLGYIDGDGDLILVGRSKELIIRGGYNIAPVEIEDVLHAHPLVREAAVVGVEHPVLGEDVAAAVVLRRRGELGEDELRAWCEERLADNKVPRVILVVDSLPYNQNAKVVKAELRPRLQEAADERRVAERGS
jgi:long-chain acyl-CoA synthetase